MSELNRDLLVVLALFGVFAWCVRRGILNAREVVWLGTALGFFAASMVFQATLRANQPAYGSIWVLLGITMLMVVPLVLAMTCGVFFLYRSLIEKELAVVEANGLTLRLVVGNIAALRRDVLLDALVNPANTSLRMGAGVAGALKSYGGATIEQEARAQAPLPIGKAVATAAGHLPARYVIHAPVMGTDARTDPDKVNAALDASLRCARKIGARRIALPAFGTGIGGLSPETVAPLTVAAILRARKDFDEVIVVVFNGRVARPFQAEFTALRQQHQAREA